MKKQPKQQLVPENDAGEVMCACANCGLHKRAKNLDELTDVYERVGPGDVMPHGQCPYCNCACYPIKEETIEITVKKARAIFTDWHVDEVTDRKKARRYADRLIRRLQEKE